MPLRKAGTSGLVFEDHELDAVLLGLNILLLEDQYGDEEDEDAPTGAASALAKIEALLPEPAPKAGSPPADPVTGEKAYRACLAEVVLAEETLRIAYVDKGGKATERVIWPLETGYFIASDSVAAFCELRGDFRHFRLDRIQSMTRTGQRTPRRRRMLLAEWQASERIHGR